MFMGGRSYPEWASPEERFGGYHMTKLFVIALTVAAAASVAHADSRKFSAADVPAAKLKSGRVVISNDDKHITAYRFAGNIREALVKLRSVRTIATTSFGGVLFNGNATSRGYAPERYT